MSLAQHVTQIEGFDYEGPANPLVATDYAQSLADNTIPRSLTPGLGPVDNKSEWRQLNFAPAEPLSLEPHIAAYKVSNARRYGKKKPFLDRSSR